MEIKSTNDANDVNTSEASTVDNVEITETDRMSEPASEIVNKYESSSDSKREKLLEGLLTAKNNNSLREHQKEALEALQETYEIKADKTYTDDEIRELDILKREKSVQNNIKEFGFNVDLDTVTSSKKFIKAYRTHSSKGLSVEDATRYAMTDLYSKPDVAKVKKTGNMTAPVNGTAPSKDSLNPLQKAMGMK